MFSSSIDSEADGQDPLPVVFRYDVGPVSSMKTNVYRPTRLGDDEETAGEQVLKPSQLGAIFHGKYNNLLKSNDRAAVIWEVLGLSCSTARIAHSEFEGLGLG